MEVPPAVITYMSNVIDVERSPGLIWAGTAILTTLFSISVLPLAARGTTDFVYSSRWRVSKLGAWA